MLWVKSTSSVPLGGLLLPLNFIINAEGKKYLQRASWWSVVLPLNLIINAEGKK